MKLTRIAVLLVLCATAPLAAPPAENKLPDELVKLLYKSKIELYSLLPERIMEKGKEESGFYGWKVLGKTTLSDADRKAVLDAVIKGIADSDGTAAKCFDPRHGLGITYENKTAGFTICFECYQLIGHGTGTSGPLTTTRAPQVLLDKILTAAQVPLAPKGKEK